MSCDPIWSVHCNGCFQWTAEERSAAEARKVARARGWWSGKAEGRVRMDYCPQCRKERGL